MREGKVAGWMATATVKENLFLVLFCFFLKEYFGLGGGRRYFHDTLAL